MNLKETIKALITTNSNVSSIAELERKLGIANGTINKWDKSIPTTTVLEKVADYFHVSVDYLLGRTKNPAQNAEKVQTDLDEALDNMMSFDGEPMTDNDREAIRAYLQGRFGK